MWVCASVCVCRCFLMSHQHHRPTTRYSSPCPNLGLRHMLTLKQPLLFGLGPPPYKLFRESCSFVLSLPFLSPPPPSGLANPGVQLQRRPHQGRQQEVLQPELGVRDNLRSEHSDRRHQRRPPHQQHHVSLPPSVSVVVLAIRERAVAWEQRPIDAFKPLHPCVQPSSETWRSTSLPPPASVGPETSHPA